MNETLIDKDYQAIITSLIKKNHVLEKEFSNYKDDIDEYYSLWIHQIKTPIAAIHLLLQSDQLNKELLTQEIFKIQQYSDMVLQYLRVGSIAHDLMIKEYSLKNMVHQVVKKYSNLFIHSKLTLHLENLDYYVLTDEKWLVFVIEQLMSNALKYTKEGSITIYSKEDKYNHFLIIKDTGIGIKKEDIPRIFERGFTGFNGRFDKKSSGIGLYLVKRIIDGLSHKIEIESEISKGTKVMLIFSKRRLNKD